MIKKRINIIIICILLLVSLVCIIKKVSWLGFVFLFITGFYFLFATRNAVNLFFRKYKTIQYLTGFVAIFAFAIALRVFVLEVYTVPSPSMKNTILPGDKILVNKLNYGPRLPRSITEIPWINIIYYLNLSSGKKINSTQWVYKRLKGFGNIKNNDIVLFNLPENEDDVYIKRCIAIPGDTLLIDESDVFINGDKQDFPGSLMFKYLLYPVEGKQSKRIPASRKIQHLRVNEYMLRDENSMIMDEYQYKEMLNSGLFDSIKKYVEYPDAGNKTFINGDGVNWSMDFFGPVVIPEKGMKIQLNHENYIKYELAIRMGEVHDIKFEDGKVLIDNKPEKYYEFSNNYYFMMGDNRYYSKDSRFVGMIPESMVIGCTKRILFSTHDGKFQWSRLLKKLD